MKKIIKEKTIKYPYSKESINSKLNLLFILSLILKIFILFPLINLIFSAILIDKFNLFTNFNQIFINLLNLILTVLISILSTKKNYIENPLFFDDEVLISNRKKNNGDYEDIYTNKFNIFLGFNIILILPLCLIISLTISSIVCLVFTVFPSIKFLLNIIKYIITLIFFKILISTFNDLLINYLKK